MDKFFCLINCCCLVEIFSKYFVFILIVVLNSVSKSNAEKPCRESKDCGLSGYCWRESQMDPLQCFCEENDCVLYPDECHKERKTVPGVYICEDGVSIEIKNHCKESLCENGGKCMEVFGNYFCDCPKGYIGINCENTTEVAAYQRMSQPYIVYKGTVKALSVGYILFFIDHFGLNFLLNISVNNAYGIVLKRRDFKTIEDPQKVCFEKNIETEICDLLPNKKLFGAILSYKFPYKYWQDQILPTGIVNYMSVRMSNFDEDLIQFEFDLYYLTSAYEYDDSICSPILSMKNCGIEGVVVNHLINHPFSIRGEILDNPLCPVRPHLRECAWRLYSVKHTFEPVVNKKPLKTGSGYTLPFDAFELGLGIYRLEFWSFISVLFVNQANRKLLSFKNFAYCYFQIVDVPIQAVIKGGFLRTVSENTKLVLDASNSRNPNKPIISQADGLSYIWSCDDTIPACKPTAVTDPIYIPEISLRSKTEIKFSLFVESDSGKRSNTVTQTITIVKEDVPELLISCVSNCGTQPYTLQGVVVADYYANPHEVVYIEVIDGKTGGFAKNIEWLGKNNSGSVDLGVIQELGHELYQLVIKEDGLAFGNEYTFTVRGIRGGESSIQVLVSENFGAEAYCEVKPSSGDKATTRFKFECFDFVTIRDFVIYELYEKGDGVLTNDVILGYSSDSLFENVILNSGQVYIRVCDYIGVCANYEIPVTLSHYEPPSDKVADMVNEIRIMDIAKSNMDEIIMRSVSVIGLIKNFENKGDIISNLVHIMSEMPINSMEDAKQYSTVITYLILKGKEITNKNMEMNCLLVASSFINKISDTINDYLTDIYDFDSEVTSECLRLIALDLLSAIAAIIELRENTLQNLDSSKNSQRVSDIVQYASKITEQVITSVDRTNIFISRRLLQDQKEVVLENSLIKSYVKVCNITKMTDHIPKHTETSNSSIKLPPNFVKTLSVVSDVFIISVNVFKKNPYWWNLFHLQPNSDIIMTTLMYRLPNSTIKKFEGNVGTKFDLYLDTHKPEVKVVKGSVTLPCKKFINNINYMDRAVAKHRLAFREGHGLSVLKFKDIDSSLRLVIVRDTAPDYNMVMESGEVVKGNYTIKFPVIKNGPHSYYYVGLLPGPEVKEGVSVSYSFEITDYECHLAVVREWNSHLCSVVADSEINNLHCQCFHWSGYGGSVFVVPNLVYPLMNSGLLMTVPQNPYIAIMVLAILTLYACMFIWCRLKDNEDDLRARIIILEDNIPTDEHPYLVVVYTGSRIGCATTAKVAFRLHGDKSVSRVHVLECCFRKILKKGSDDWFLIYTPCKLGDLKKIYIWMDYSGSSPSWFCDKIVVIDIESEKEYEFLLDTWFTLLLERYEIAYCFKINCEDHNSVKKKRMLLDNVLINMKEGHLWTGLFVRHPRSNLTRKERLTVGVLLLLNTMLVNLMFFGVLKEGIVMDNSKFELTLRQIVVSLESLLITAPVGFIIVFCFKKSKIEKPVSKDVSKAKKNRGLFERLIMFMVNKVETVISMKPLRPVLVTPGSIPYRRRKFWLVLGWTLSLFVILTDSLLLFIYGLKLGRKKSETWIVSILVAKCQGYIIVQPTKLIIYSIALTLIFKKHQKMADYETKNTKELIEYNRERKQFTNKINQIRSRPCYLPLPKKKIHVLRTHVMTSWEQKWITYECLGSILCIIAILIAVAQFNIKEYYLTNSRITKLINSPCGTNNVKFSDISSKEQLLDFLKNGLLPRLHYIKKREDLNASNSAGESKGTYNSRLVGKVIIRQQRVKEGTCTVDKSFRPLIDTCNNLLTLGNEDRSDYGTSWTNSITRFSESAVDASWKYRDRWKSESIDEYGKSGNLYHSGGYIAAIGTMYYESLIMLNELDELNWFDSRTRVIIVEFILYNVNTQIFSPVMLIVENFGSGTYITRHSVKSVSPHKPLDIVVAACLCFLTICILLLLLRMVYVMQLYGLREYFSFVQHILQCIIVGIGAIAMVSYGVGNVFNIQYYTYLRDPNKIQFSHYYNPIHSDETFKAFLGLLVLFIIIRLIFLLEQVSLFSVFTANAYLATSYIFIILISVLFLIFILNGCTVLLQNPPFMSYTIFLINPLNFRQIASSMLFPEDIKFPYILCFCCILMFLLIAAIIICHYINAKRGIQYVYTYNIFKYAYNLIKCLLKRKIRLRGGADDVININNEFYNQINNNKIDKNKHNTPFEIDEDRLRKMQLITYRTLIEEKQRDEDKRKEMIKITLNTLAGVKNKKSSLKKEKI